ncbi:CobW family GTP-binding protein [Variovorax sp. PBL-E5]|uniref:CobW family GTP-binding protein n=1 Tax=Variovorax sp. PBL-E5 TaxID=434014 RepID=UPI001319A0E8|nr:GTP-binding protein [Variovorax sp. PBL-E5]VTU45365.1 putative GTP-binding protein YjiA [Variovorax sp. PBL-E5]
MAALFPASTSITFLTGFLGSGKTTVLNVLLRDRRLKDTAVIVNEFGEVGLDHLLISQADENVVLLDSGCICCTIGNGLSETLETLYRQRLQGKVPNFSRVVVETTGLADPFPMLRLALSDYFVSKHFVINGVLTTVDSANGLSQLVNHREARNQVAVASRITVTKTDLCTPHEVEQLSDAIRGINANAVVTESGQSPAGDVMLSDEIYEFIINRPAAEEWLKEAVSSHALSSADHGHASTMPGPFNHDERIESHAFYWDEPVAWDRYTGWLDQLRTLPAEDLMRVKGLVALGEGQKPYVIQGVQHVFAAPLRLAAWPSEDRRSRLVVIARGVQRPALDRIFSS